MSDIHLLSSYDYMLPEHLIAQIPESPADASRLLVREPDGTVRDTVFHALAEEMESDRVMFFNDSKVIRSRIPLPQARLMTADGRNKVFNGEVFFLEEIDSDTFKAMVYPGDAFPIGWTIHYKDVVFRITEMIYEGRILHISGSGDIWSILERYGQMPLPPYIEYSQEKEQGYQSILAEKRGSLAAPTASLHFTPRLLDGLRSKGIGRDIITLHVGLGTFKNIYEEDIRDYVMHSERAEVPVSVFETIAHQKSEGKTILAVGTTVTRTLESLPYLWRFIRDGMECSQEVRDFWDSKSLEREKDPLSAISFSPDKKTIFFSSALFIYGKYRFQVVDEIITNFHLPKSTLFILISSFLWLNETKKLYSYAVDHAYRFFSFGDAMYLKVAKK